MAFTGGGKDRIITVRGLNSQGKQETKKFNYDFYRTSLEEAVSDAISKSNLSEPLTARATTLDIPPAHQVFG